MKLDGQAKEGQWVGFDEESKGHQIYWAEKRSVTVERSVKFIPNEVSIGGNVPLEGEEKLDEKDKDLNQAEDVERSIFEPENNEQPEIETPTTQKQPELIPEVEEMGHGKHVHKKLSYVRCIQDGEGSASNFTSSNALPLGLQTVSEQAGVADCCIMPAKEDFAMATVIAAAEDLEPSYNEVK